MIAKRIFYLLLFIALLLYVVIIKEENERLQKEIANLTNANIRLENERMNLETEMNGLLNENELLKEEILQQKDLSSDNDIIIAYEGFLIDPVLIYPEELSVQLVIKMLGEPKEFKEYVNEAHCGCKEFELIYDEAEFIFRKAETKEAIRSMTIKDSFMMTHRGISIGSTKEQVIQAYGKNNIEYEGIKYGEKTGIRFTFIDDFVSEIFIWYMYE